MYQRFGTPDGTAKERFDFWRTWYSEVVDAPMLLEPVAELPADFQSSAEVLEVGDISIVEVHCGPAIGRWSRAGTEASDLLRVDLLSHAPDVTGHWHGQDVIARSGTAVLFGRTSGFWRAPQGLRAIQINVPRRLLPVEDAAVERVTARHLPADSPVFEAMIRPMLAGMIGRLGELSQTVTVELHSTWISLITMLVRSLDRQPTDGMDLAEIRRLRVLQFIEQRLSDPGLKPDSLARALGISRRGLYHIFAGDDGIAATIRRLRLDRARTALVDPAQRSRPIGDVARAVGLPNAAHFSRLFQAEFGASPRELRARAIM